MGGRSIRGGSFEQNERIAEKSSIKPMKFTLTSILVAAGLLVAIVFLLGYGFSDWILSSWNYEEIQEKPWRPIARLTFSFIMISLLICTTGLVLKVRNR